MKSVLPTCVHVGGTCSFLFLFSVAMCIISMFGWRYLIGEFRNLQSNQWPYEH